MSGDPIIIKPHIKKFSFMKFFLVRVRLFFGKSMDMTCEKKKKTIQQQQQNKKQG